MSETGKPLHWVVQYCSMVRPYKGPFTWSDCLHWIPIGKFNTKEEAEAFMETEGEQHKHSFVGAALRVYPIYPSVTLNKYRPANPDEEETLAIRKWRLRVEETRKELLERIKVVKEAVAEEK